MNSNLINKVLQYRIHGFISSIILLSVFLFSAYQVNIKAMGYKVFVGRVTAQIKMSTCTMYQYNICRVCTLCGCGQWDQNTISPIFGRNANSSMYACKMSSYQPMGQGNFDVGSIVYGTCTNEKLSAWNPMSCNIWSVRQ